MKVLIKAIFESQGKVKMAEEWFQKNVNVSPKKTITEESLF